MFLLAIFFGCSRIFVSLFSLNCRSEILAVERKHKNDMQRSIGQSHEVHRPRITHDRNVKYEEEEEIAAAAEKREIYSKSKLIIKLKILPNKTR